MQHVEPIPTSVRIRLAIAFGACAIIPLALLLALMPTQLSALAWLSTFLAALAGSAVCFGAVWAMVKPLEARRESGNYTQSLQAVGLEIGGEMAAFSLPKLSQLIVDRARELMQADFAILCLQDPQSGAKMNASSGLPEDASANGSLSTHKLCCPSGVVQINPSCSLACSAAPTKVAVPLAWGSVHFGELCVGYRTAKVVSQNQLNFLRDFCHMAAIGVSNARLHWNLEDLATFEERERIAGDLHDGIIQSLYGTGLGLVDCMRLVDESPAKARERLQKTIEDLNGVIRDVRNFIVGLECEALRATSLSHAISDFVTRMSLNGSVKVELDVDAAIDRALSREQSGQLFQICRELFLNIVKHAQAAKVLVRLQKTAGGVCLDIGDDGCGFDTRVRTSSGHGLKNLEMRARRLGATLKLESTQGQGTRIRLELPLERTA